MGGWTLTAGTMTGPGGEALTASDTELTASDGDFGKYKLGQDLREYMSNMSLLFPNLLQLPWDCWGWPPWRSDAGGNEPPPFPLSGP